MPRFGWTRLAYLLLVLTVLAALARVGGPDAEARFLAARSTDESKPPSGQQESPQVTRLTDDEISSLEDLRGSTGRPPVGPNIAEPRLPIPPVPDEVERPQTATGRKPAEQEPVASATGPPVFYRPSGPASWPDGGPVCGNLSGAPKDGRIVFPLEKRFYYSYEDTWGAPRTQGGHEGTDLMTPSGVPEYALTDGTVVPVAGSDPDGWNTLGGHAVMVRSDYSIGPVKEGDLFYYAHLERKSPLPIGARVRAGQVVGYAGDTGQGPPGTSGLFPPHLHLGWYDGTGDREEADSGAMNPYPLLEWIKSNGGAVTGASDARYCEAPRPGPPTPSGAGDWPVPADPGVSPDLDTGSKDPRPTPAQRDTRKERPKPKPAAERDARRQNPPAGKPGRQNRPERRPHKTPEDAPAKPSNRPEAAKPPGPGQPSPGPAGPEPPAPEPNTPKPPDASGQSTSSRSNPSSSSESQYDPDTGAAPGHPTNRSESRKSESDPTMRPPGIPARGS